MSTPTVDYAAVLTDLKAQRERIDHAIAAIENLVSATPTAAPSSPTASDKIAPNAFFGLSIPDAAKKYLTIVQAKKSTQDLMKALEAGGLPPMVYSTVYAVLRRRQNVVGDIVNLKGDWGLAEWFPNYSFKRAGKNGAEATPDAPEESEEETLPTQESNK